MRVKSRDDVMAWRTELFQSLPLVRLLFLYHGQRAVM
jgi:hypothetical protein